MDFEKLSRQQKQMIELLEHKIERYHVEVEGVMDRLADMTRERDALMKALQMLVKKVMGVNVYGNYTSDEDDDRRAAHELNVAREMADEVLSEIERPNGGATSGKSHEHN